MEIETSEVMKNYNDFPTCFKYYGDTLGYSETVFFGWKNKIYTTEVK